MASQDQLQEVQQQIEAVLDKVSEMETSLAAAEEAVDGDRVRFLRDRLVQLDKGWVILREEKNKLTVAQTGGQHCCMNTDCPATNWLAFLPELSLFLSCSLVWQLSHP